MPTKSLVTSYEQDLQRFPDRWQKTGLILAMILLATFPLLFDNYVVTIGTQALIATVGAIGLMILTGFAGQISMGHAAFLAIGAYSTAVLGLKFHLPYWLVIPLGGLIAAMVGLAIGPFALKLRGLYLAIVTVGLVFLVNHLLMHWPDVTGGPTGIAVPANLGFSSAPNARELSDYTANNPLMIAGLGLEFEQLLYYFCAVVAVLSVLAAHNIKRSHTGRAMMAVRDQDIAASVLGIHPARSKIIAFGISSFFAGVAGGLLALQQTYLNVDNFNLHLSIEYIAMIVLGGIGTVFGAVAGAIAFVSIEPLSHLLGDVIPFMSGWSDSEQSTFLFACIICAFLVFEPLGLFGIWLRIKRYFAAWPFKY